MTSGKHTQLTTNTAEDRQPVLSADEKTLYFLSERSGTFNVYKMLVNDVARAEQLSKFSTHPVRFLSIGVELYASVTTANCTP